MASVSSYKDSLPDLPDVNRFIKDLNIDTPVCSSPLKFYDTDPMQRQKEWRDLEIKVKNFVKERIMTKDGFLREGIKLYHSSLNSELDFDKFDKDKYTYFGLDIVISLWYILEMADSEVEEKKRNQLMDIFMNLNLKNN